MMKIFNNIENKEMNKELDRVFWRSFQMEFAWNYERQMNLGYVYAMIPVLKKIYANDKEGLKKALKRHLEFFNMTPHIVTLMLGISSAMEKENSESENFDENFGLDVPALSEGKSKFTLILGSDFYTDENANLLAALTGVIARATPFRVMLIPPRTNSLGVAKICTLTSEKKPGKTLGYNENGDYKFSIFEGDIDASALNQQEGTFTSINNALVPTNVAIPHKGYFLNDIANALRLMAKDTIDYTPNLPKEKGYKGIKFDDLENFYANDGTSHRGYKLEISNFTPKEDIESLFKEKNEPNLKDGEALVSLANPINLPSFFANYATQTAKRAKLYASSEFMAKFEISQNEAIILEKDGHKLAICVELDSELSGVGAYIGDYDDKLDVGVIFNGKSYAPVKIIKAKDE